MKIQGQNPAPATSKAKVHEIKSPGSFARIKPTGSFARRMVLIGLLALSTASAIKAQVTQIEFADDSVAMGFFCSAYAEQMKKASQTPATLEFIGTFEVFIPINPSSELKIRDSCNNDTITLNAAEQKQLLQEPRPLFVENGTYLFTYILPQYLNSTGLFNTTGDGDLIQQGRLKVFKKKQPAKAPSDSLK